MILKPSLNVVRLRTSREPQGSTTSLVLPEVTIVAYREQNEILIEYFIKRVQKPTKVCYVTLDDDLDYENTTILSFQTFSSSYSILCLSLGAIVFIPLAEHLIPLSANALCSRTQFVLHRHPVLPNNLLAAALSPDSQRLVLVSSGETRLLVRVVSVKFSGNSLDVTEEKTQNIPMDALYEAASGNLRLLDVQISWSPVGQAFSVLVTVCGPEQHILCLLSVLFDVLHPLFDSTVFGEFAPLQGPFECTHGCIGRHCLHTSDVRWQIVTKKVHNAPCLKLPMAWRPDGRYITLPLSPHELRPPVDEYYISPGGRPVPLATHTDLAYVEPSYIPLQASREFHASQISEHTAFALFEVEELNFPHEVAPLLAGEAHPTAATWSPDSRVLLVVRGQRVDVVVSRNYHWGTVSEIPLPLADSEEFVCAHWQGPLECVLSFSTQDGLLLLSLKLSVVQKPTLPCNILFNVVDRVARINTCAQTMVPPPLCDTTLAVGSTVDSDVFESDGGYVAVLHSFSVDVHAVQAEGVVFPSTDPAPDIAGKTDEQEARMMSTIDDIEDDAPVDPFESGRVPREDYPEPPLHKVFEASFPDNFTPISVIGGAMGETCVVVFGYMGLPVLLFFSLEKPECIPCVRELPTCPRKLFFFRGQLVVVFDSGSLAFELRPGEGLSVSPFQGILSLASGANICAVPFGADDGVLVSYGEQTPFRIGGRALDHAAEYRVSSCVTATDPSGGLALLAMTLDGILLMILITESPGKFQTVIGRAISVRLLATRQCEPMSTLFFFDWPTDLACGPPRVRMQVPRGNLEEVRPRALALRTIEATLRSSNFEPFPFAEYLQAARVSLGELLGFEGGLGAARAMAMALSDKEFSYLVFPPSSDKLLDFLDELASGTLGPGESHVGAMSRAASLSRPKDPRVYHKVFTIVKRAAAPQPLFKKMLAVSSAPEIFSFCVRVGDAAGALLVSELAAWADDHPLRASLQARLGSFYPKFAAISRALTQLPDFLSNVSSSSGPLTPERLNQITAVLTDALQPLDAATSSALSEHARRHIPAALQPKGIDSAPFFVRLALSGREAVIVAIYMTLCGELGSDNSALLTALAENPKTARAPRLFISLAQSALGASDVEWPTDQPLERLMLSLDSLEYDVLEEFVLNRTCNSLCDTWIQDLGLVLRLLRGRALRYDIVRAVLEAANTRRQDLWRHLTAQTRKTEAARRRASALSGRNTKRARSVGDALEKEEKTLAELISANIWNPDAPPGRRSALLRATLVAALLALGARTFDETQKACTAALRDAENLCFKVGLDEVAFQHEAVRALDEARADFDAALSSK
eukprot:gnl/Chilomastix_cuspidata/1622.p1 GENE.gnl/Chilomastix_cuspidata/1622~~gnl/Chilomastix_cuspidata/1622.p1  ORF type:complete len:1327 (-),score=184.34 gnl/Chilomastix_cuspidata/1622:10-3990(-)